MKKICNSLTFFIGIDVSKLTLDVTVLIPDSSTKKYKPGGTGTQPLPNSGVNVN